MKYWLYEDGRLKWKTQFFPCEGSTSCQRHHTYFGCEDGHSYRVRMEFWSPKHPHHLRDTAAWTYGSPSTNDTVVSRANP